MHCCHNVAKSQCQEADTIQRMGRMALFMSTAGVHAADFV